MSTVYHLYYYTDNPLFEGLSIGSNLRKALNDLVPEGWNNPENYWTWEAPRWKDRWPNPPPEVRGQVRRFNDFPMDYPIPAFSQRAVDYLRDLLEPNGELLPVRHRNGIYYLYNCTTLVNCLDLERSVYEMFDDGTIDSFEKYAFHEELVKDLSFFRLRPEPLDLLCTQVVVDRVKKYGLNGFRFIKMWSSEEGPTDYRKERRLTGIQGQKIKLAEGPELDAKGNTVVIRLLTAKKKATKQELKLVERIMDELDELLYEPEGGAEQFYGQVEGHDVVANEVRIFLTCPDCDRLVEKLLPYLRQLPWPRAYQVVKRYGEYVDEEAREEYVRL